MHARGLLHRDIQLGNCVLGLPPNNTTIYMIDFGFSKFYIDQRTKRHIPDSKAPRDFIGNYWFSSVRVHCRGSGAPLPSPPFVQMNGMLKVGGLQCHHDETIWRPLRSCSSTCSRLVG